MHFATAITECPEVYDRDVYDDITQKFGDMDPKLQHFLGAVASVSPFLTDLMRKEDAWLRERLDAIEIDQSIRFYSRELQERGFLKIVAFKEQDFGTTDNYIELKISGSEKYILPDALQGESIQLGFYYQHEHFIGEDGKDKYNAPSWGLSGVKVFDLEPAK